MNRARFLKTIAALAVAPSVIKEIDWLPAQPATAIVSNTEMATERYAIVATSAASAAALTVSNNGYFRAGDIIRNTATGETMQVLDRQDFLDGLHVQPFPSFRKAEQDRKFLNYQTCRKNPLPPRLAQRRRSSDAKPKNGDVNRNLQ